MHRDEPLKSIPFLQTRLPRVEEYLPYLKQIDQNNWYSNFGPLVKKFEQECLTNYFSSRGDACTVANCTLGLIIALQASARPSGRYVLMPSFTFAATALAAKWAGFQPYFIDIDPKNWTVDTRQIEEAISTLGDDVAAVMPYATFGTTLDLSYYQELEERGIPVIVDAAPGLGSVNPDATTFGTGFDGSIVFSLHATKPFGIGEGGLVYSANAETIERIRRLSNFGFSSPGVLEMAGINAKLSEFSAAVGLAVIKNYRQKLSRLDSLFDAYVQSISGHEDLRSVLSIQSRRGDVPHQLMPVLLPVGIDIADLKEKLLQSGIQTRRYFKTPCHQQQTLDDSPCGSLDVTDEVAQRIICLPLWDGMEATLPQFIMDELASALES
jgi:dTDP-4-amino-4,6-dideoxygalactose transaminase